MSAGDYLNPEQFKPLSPLTNPEKKNISLTTAVRGGFRPLGDTSMARVAHSKPFPHLMARPMGELMETLKPGSTNPRHWKARYN